MHNIHWIQGDNLCESPLFRRSFYLKQTPVSAKIEICGLGYFHFFMNGRRIGNQEFIPALTNYSSILGNDTTYPVWEERTNYRCMYISYDLMEFLTEGENIIGFQLGNGWYHQTCRKSEGDFLFGFPKIRYELTIILSDGEKIILESDPITLWKPSSIIKNNLFSGETQDLRLLQDNWCTVDADLSGWKPSRPTHAPETELTSQKCPEDKIVRTINPDLFKKNGTKKLYDCGENITGWAVIQCTGSCGASIYIKYSEELDHLHQCLDFQSSGGKDQIQEDIYICNGTTVIAHPEFCWHAFRYFEVDGPGEAVSVSVIHTDISVTSSFQCSDPVLNWLYNAYIRTQLNNYHNCIPSDCPHRERLGYTGDGQLTSESAMMTLNTRQLYEKWYQDILDSQGIDSGHIPHTAPFLGGGGGPGGWGGAVYIIPTNYYRIYGDPLLLQWGYTAILHWLEYMHARCENGLIVQEENGGWCLGEWCAPASEPSLIPAPFVNTWFYIRGLQGFNKAAEILHKPKPTWVKKRMEESLNAIIYTYYDRETEDFCSGTGAANAFALYIGLGSFRTKANLIDKYSKLGRFDTGVFGTPILLEILFRENQANLAYQLLTNTNSASFVRMMQAGATTLWENWEGTASHNHPMFGSVIKLLFTEVLGIRQKEGDCGFKKYYVAPADIEKLSWAKGSIQTAEGTISVNWVRNEDNQKIIIL